MNQAIRLGLEKKIARRIGIETSSLDLRKREEMNSIVLAYRAFRSGKSGHHAYPPEAINDRMDVKFCINDKGRKKNSWKRLGRQPVRFAEILVEADGRQVDVGTEDDYQFLRVNYQGDVTDGDLIPGSECSYRYLFQTKTWDILISNMGVGRGAIGIVPPYHSGKYVSNEYTILRASGREQAVYYSNLIKTKEILGDILSSTTGMNRGRIDWAIINEVEVPEFHQADAEVTGLVSALESIWAANMKFKRTSDDYLGGIANEMGLNDPDAQERWLAFKPPE